MLQVGDFPTLAVLASPDGLAGGSFKHQQEEDSALLSSSPLTRQRFALLTRFSSATECPVPESCSPCMREVYQCFKSRKVWTVSPLLGRPSWKVLCCMHWSTSTATQLPPWTTTSRFRAADLANQEQRGEHRWSSAREDSRDLTQATEQGLSQTEGGCEFTKSVYKMRSCKSACLQDNQHQQPLLCHPTKCCMRDVPQVPPLDMSHPNPCPPFSPVLLLLAIHHDLGLLAAVDDHPQAPGDVLDLALAPSFGGSPRNKTRVRESDAYTPILNV